MLLAKFDNVEIHKITDTNYEVRVIRYTKNEKTINYPDGRSRHIPVGAAIQPKDRDWGRYGYTYMDLGRAVMKASSILGYPVEYDNA